MMSSHSTDSNSELLSSNRITAIYGSFSSDMSAISSVDISQDIQKMVNNNILVLQKNLNFKENYPVQGHNRYLKIICNEREYFIADDNYSRDIVIDLPKTERDLAIVYNAFIMPDVYWQDIIGGQLLQMRSYGILPEVDFYVHITDTCQHADEVVKLVKNIVPQAIISVSKTNEFEYPGIKLIHDLSKQNPKRNYIYLHTKGMSHVRFSRSLEDITLMAATFSRWRKNIQYLGSDGVKKVGVFPAFSDDNPSGLIGGKGGWVWYNFWFAAGDYLANCPEPLLTRDRYYYEEWLGWQVGDTMPVMRNDSKSLYSIKLFKKSFYSSLEAQVYLLRLIYKINYSKISKDLPYIIKSSLVFHLWLKVKTFFGSTIKF